MSIPPIGRASIAQGGSKLPRQPVSRMDPMDTSPSPTPSSSEEKTVITFPVFSTLSPTKDESHVDPIPSWLARASESYTNENIVKKLQQTKYDRVVKMVVRDGIENIMLNRYTPMILPSFQDEARLSSMGLNASAAAISGECGELLDCKKVSQYFTNYSPGSRLLMANMEKKDCKDFRREKIHYQKPPYDADHDPVVIQRKIQQLRLHGMSRLRKGLLEMQKENRTRPRSYEKSSGSDSSSPTPRSQIPRPSKLNFPSSVALRTDSKLDDFNIKRPLQENAAEIALDSAKMFKRASVNEEILATKLEDSMSTDSDSDAHVSVNSSLFNSPNVPPPAPIGLELKEEESAEESSSSSARSSSSSENGGEVEVKSGTESSIEEGQFEVVEAGSDSDGSISF